MTGFWGGMFPDAARQTVMKPAVAATLALSSVATSGVLDGLTARARVLGAAGNAYDFSIVADAADATEVAIDEAAGSVVAHIQDDATTVQELFDLVNADSVFIEIVGGAFNPTDIVATGDDEFAATPLTGGAPASSYRLAYWGGHFPDAGTADDEAVTVPETAASFVLRLEGGTRLTLTWGTDIHKGETGIEHRGGIADDPLQAYSGAVLLLDGEPLSTRSTLERMLSTGAPFSLALPFEQTTLTQDADGTTVYLDTTAVDWAVPGTRVAIVGVGDAAAEGVIQSSDSDHVVLDEAPGSLAAAGFLIMPMMPVVLDAEQAFDRYQTAADAWKVAAKATQYGFASAGTKAELQLGPITDSGFDGAYLRARTATSASIEVSLSAGAELAIDESYDPGGGGSLEITVEDSVTTMAELAAAINAQSLLMQMLGTWTDADIAASPGTNEFLSTALTGGADPADPVYGRGQIPAVFTDVISGDDRFIWDPPIENERTLAEQVHGLAEEADLPGLPVVVGVATTPDWARSIVHSGEIASAEWQWTKAMFAALRGSWRSFWLPTWRDDLVSVADATTTEIRISNLIGDYTLWAGRGYNMLRVEQGTAISYVQITAAVDNGDDTTTLTVAPSSGEDPPVADAVDRLSWLELVHLEGDVVQVGFAGSRFSTSPIARVVQQ